MTVKAAAGISIASLNAASASEKPFEFEYLFQGRTPTGIFLKVLGAQNDAVQAAINSAVNARNKAQQQAQAVLKPGEPLFVPIEDNEAFTFKLAAIRLVGWRAPGETEGLEPEQVARFQGIAEPYSPDLAFELVKANPDIRAQVIEKSNDLGNFMKVSSRKS